MLSGQPRHQLREERSGDSAGERAQIEHTLHSLPQVVSFTFQSQQQAYEQAKQLFANEPVMLNFVQPGDLPASFQVKMKNAQTDAGPVTEALLGRPGVDSVGDDAAILTKFYQLLNGARNAVIVVAIILIIAAILLVANTIRLSAFNRRRETAIMRLVGASNFYVQLPFLVEGMIAGLFGWLIATGLLAGCPASALTACSSTSRSPSSCPPPTWWRSCSSRC